MKKSIYNTLYEDKHNIFRERLKSLCKDKYLTYAGLADKLDYKEDTVKGWAKKSGGFPNMNTLIKLSCIFDVDVAYLLGEQNYKKIVSQRIHNLSGLGEVASNIIESTKDNMRDAYTLNKLLTHKNFPRLLETIWQYAHCHNVEIKIKDTTFSTDNFFPFTDSKKKTAFKFTATDTFSEILEDMYKENEELMECARGDAALKEMFELIHQWNIEIETNNYGLENLISESKEKLLKTIGTTLKTLPQYPVYNIFRKFSSEDILKNYQEISKALNISLDVSTPPQKGSE